MLSPSTNHKSHDTKNSSTIFTPEPENEALTISDYFFKLWLDRQDATCEKPIELLTDSGHSKGAEQVMDAVALS